VEIKEFKEPLRTGQYNGKEYVGAVVKVRDNLFIGNIVEVPAANKTSVFGEHITGTFDNYESARDFVVNEWTRKFGN
jgi:hypothetical protein